MPLQWCIQSARGGRAFAFTNIIAFATAQVTFSPTTLSRGQQRGTQTLVFCGQNPDNNNNTMEEENRTDAAAKATDERIEKRMNGFGHRV